MTDLDIESDTKAVSFIGSHLLRHVLLNKSLIVIWCLTISGCMLLGPSYHKPVVVVPKKWPHQPIAQAANQPIALKDMAWWRQYHQTELNSLIETALQHNNDLHSALANIDYAESQLMQVKLNWLPGMSVLAGYSQFPILANPGGFVLAAPLYVVNILQQYKQQKGAEQLVFASLYARDCAKLMIIAQVATSYFTLIAQLEALALYDTLLHDYQRYLNLAHSQYRFGLISEDDVDVLESRISQIQAQIERVKHNIVVSKNALHYALNENPGDITIKASFETLNSNAIIPQNIPANVLRNRPDIRRAEAVLKSAHANIGATIATLLPSITIGAYLGTGTTSQGPFNLLEAYPSIPVVDLPVYAEISGSKAQFKALYSKYIDTVRMALRDVDNNLSDYTARTKQLQHIRSALLHEKQHCLKVKQRYRFGIDDELEVIHCQIKLDKLTLIKNHTKLTKMLSVVKLYQDLAGGYDRI